MYIDKIEKLIHTLETNREAFDQTVWGYKDKSRRRCVSAACVAGHTITMEGYYMIFDTPLGDGRFATHCRKGKEKQTIAETARSILGLDFANSMILFDASAENWRHGEELNKAKTPAAKVKAAVAELRDLIKLGPYFKEEEEEVSAPEPELVEVNS